MHKQAAFKSTHSHIHIGELGEPELPLLGHLILKDQVAAVGRSGDSDAQRHAGTGCEVSRQTDSLVAVVRAVAKTSAGTGEVDTEIHEPAAGVRPGLAASVGDRDAVGLGLIGAPAGRCTGHAVGGHPLWGCANHEVRRCGMAENAVCTGHGDDHASGRRGEGRRHRHGRRGCRRVGAKSRAGASWQTAGGQLDRTVECATGSDRHRVAGAAALNHVLARWADGKREVGCDAARKLERTNSRVPVESAVRRQVLVRVPEGAVIAGIHGEARVIPPPGQSHMVSVHRLRTTAVDDGALAKWHLTEWVAGQPARVVDLGMKSGARDAEACRQVA